MNISEIERLARLLRDSPEVGSIELRGWFGRGVVITRNGYAPTAAPAMVAHHAPAPAMHAPAAEAPRAEPAAAPASALKEIKSPMVGTFYRAPEPGAEPYVKVGSRVSAGQTVCIIEAMKIMNEIEAEITGVVREVCVEDTQPVEFGTVLFRVDPNG
ncbi:MAG: acetyl-CoA carboxylase biotin carboxyl carrier protein [Gemmatimonadales bacterium]